ncbi:hypothetical protein ACPZ19_15285 [Amycolatopsis lurida]
MTPRHTFGEGFEDRFPDFAEFVAAHPEYGLGTTPGNRYRGPGLRKRRRRRGGASVTGPGWSPPLTGQRPAHDRAC